MEKKKVLVLMSGGVDSSVAAVLLKDAGHDVSGVYLKLWDSADSKGLHTTDYTLPTQLGDPCWAVEMRDAARVAAKLGIPFDVWDVTEDYKTRVLENFYAEYEAGRTPNPDVLCNSEIKFGVGLERAIAAGYEYVATGHYARVEEMKNAECRMQNGLPTTSYVLRTAFDKNKDQSYFLWRLTQEQLAHVMFPIGEYTKPQVRELAEKFGLHNAGKKDSQGVCFLGKIDLKEFLYKHAKQSVISTKRPDGARGEISHGANKQGVRSLDSARDDESGNGPIVDVHGTHLGTHDGLAHFTIGQRHGTKLGGTGPYFVVEKDVAANTLIVANTEDEPKYRTVECTVKNAELRMQNEELKTGGEVHCMARTRYRAPLAKVVIDRSHATTQSHNVHDEEIATPLFDVGARNDSCVVTFDEPARAVAPGQSIVFYDGERVIGGGIIDTVTLLCKVQKFATVS